MINSIEDLRSAGTLPTGPVSAWPKERNVAGPGMQAQYVPGQQDPEPKVKASLSTMAKGLVRSAGMAIRHGKISEEIRNERFETCQKCPAYNHNSSRCSECGCFMKVKTWINGDPDLLCPLRKWER